METEIKENDRILWTYTHWLNSRSSTRITKHGIFLRLLSGKTHKKYGDNYAVVHFDNNKGVSYCRIDELKKEKPC